VRLGRIRTNEGNERAKGPGVRRECLEWGHFYP
jgi:hypothetical protein